jgi:hypothetical protein
MFFIAALFVAIIIAAFQSIQLRRIQQKCWKTDFSMNKWLFLFAL